MNIGQTIRWHFDGTVGRVLFAALGLFVIQDLNVRTRIFLARRDVEAIEVETCVACGTFVTNDEVRQEFSGREFGRDHFEAVGCVHCLSDETDWRI